MKRFAASFFSNADPKGFRKPLGSWRIKHRVLPGVLNLTIFIAWIWLFWPVFQYLGVLFSNDEFRSNQIILALVAGLLVYQAWKARIHPIWDALPRLSFSALTLALSAALAYLLEEKYLDINTLAACLFVVGSYALLGLWMAPTRWRQGFPAMFLVAGILPFGEHLETFVGYPLRVLTAGLVRDGLSAMGFHSVGVDTILTFESGMSQVDIPCSGVKSLWTGMLFLLAVTWIENRRLSLRWLLAALAVALGLVTSNLVRVALLALTGPALGWPRLAEMLHLPLGVLGFGAVCAAAFWMVRGLPASKQIADDVTPHTVISRPVWLAPLILVVTVGLALSYSPRFNDQGVAAANSLTWQFPSNIFLHAAPLNDQEMAWIRQTGADRADRYAFSWQDSKSQPVDGTLMLLTSRTWRGQHRPERCLEVFGFTVHEAMTVLAKPDFPMRVLSLTYGVTPERLTAVYWLQSRGQTTEDFSKRIWSDLGSPQVTWALITVVFDGSSDPQSDELASFWSGLHDTVAAGLVEGGG